MTRRRGLSEGVHITFLGVWLGALVMMAVSAPLVFITLDTLEPMLADYQAYREPHYRIAGGHIVQRLFAVCDLVQTVSALAAALSLGLIAWDRNSGRALTLARGAALILVIGILSYRFYLLDPALRTHLEDYWRAAAAGGGAKADELRAIYDRGHAFERKLFAATAVLVLTMLGLALRSLGLAGRPSPKPE